jgi:hypothetical protein
MQGLKYLATEPEIAECITTVNHANMQLN